MKTTSEPTFKDNLEKSLADWEWQSVELIDVFDGIKSRLELDLETLGESIYNETQIMITKAITNVLHAFFEKPDWILTYPEKDDIKLELNTLGHGFDSCPNFPQFSLKDLLGEKTWEECDEQEVIDRLYKIIDQLKSQIKERIEE